MKRIWICILALTGLVLGLAACGNDATNTAPAPQTTVATNTNITLAPGQTTVVPAVVSTPAKGGNSILATITANSGNSGSPQTAVPAPPSLAAPTPTSLATDTLPVYSGFKTLNFGIIGTQISQQFSRTGANITTSVYSTGDDFTKVSDFYSSELVKLGFAKAGASDLPASTLLPGKVVLFGKGTGNSLQGLVIIAIGPLDTPTLSALGSQAPDVANLKVGDNIVLVLSGLTGSYLSDLQKDLVNTTGSTTPAPTK